MYALLYSINKIAQVQIDIFNKILNFVEFNTHWPLKDGNN